MSTPPTDPKSPLAEYWTKPVSTLAEIENRLISPGDAERHTIFSLLALSLVADAFNGNKKGAVGQYPWRKDQEIDHPVEQQGQVLTNGRYRGDRHGDRYFGHNIACLAVDGRGEIIDFEFNHNELYNSSAEHAEARLVRRIFNVNQVFDHWETIDPNTITDVPYSNVLSAVTIYTTLESCAQCSGIMTLGNVKSIVYLQTDPGQYLIGNIMYNLSNPLDYSKPSTYLPDPARPPSKYGAPEPIPGDLYGFELKAKLEIAYEAFRTGVTPQKPFWRSADGNLDKSNSITSFLCTDAANAIFEEAATRLDGFVPSDPTYAPIMAAGSLPSFTNAEILKQAKLFRIYASKAGRRATSHR